MIESFSNFNRLRSCNRISIHVTRYPADLFRRAKINSVLDWHHSNLRIGAGMLLNICFFFLIIINAFQHHILVFVSRRWSFLSYSQWLWWLIFPCFVSFSAPFIFNTVLAPLFGRPQNSQAAAEAEMLLSKSLSKIESFWLKGNGKFLLGGFKPSIADLSLVCEIMQLEVRIHTEQLLLIAF